MSLGRAYLHIAKMQIMTDSAYRFSMLISLVIAPLYVLVQYFVWSSVLNNGSQLISYDLTAILVYFALTMIINTVVFDFASHSIEEFVMQGIYAQILLRPISLLGRVFWVKVGNRSLAFLIEIIPLLVIFSLFLGLDVIIPSGSIIIFVLGLASAFVMSLLFRYMYSLIAFWMERINSFRLLDWGLMLILAGVSFPLDIVPMWAQKILVLLPFQHFVYAPIKYFTGGFNLAGISATTNLFIGFAWIIIFLVGGHYLHKRAVLKYTGVGQ